MQIVASSPENPRTAGPHRELTLLDATSVAVGIIIGSAIYQLSPTVIASVPNLAALLLVWIAGGLIALVGALTYAELASAYPEDGGDYIYLRRAFGKRLAFVYAWSELLVIRPGSMGTMAYVFAEYLQELLQIPAMARVPGNLSAVFWAVVAILAMSLVNRAGVKQSKWTQYGLTSAKLIGLFAIFVAALIGPGQNVPLPDLTLPPRSTNIHRAMILIVFAYGGWNDIVFVAAETHEPRRNIPRALLLSLGIVAVVYLATNFAFIHTLGYELAAQSKQIAARMMEVRFGEFGSRFVSGLICVSALGAINGMILTRSRIYTAVGRDYPRLANLATWNPRTGAPEPAIRLQTLATLALVMVLGLVSRGFESMVVFTTPVFWFFLLLVGVSLFVLRRTDPHTPRPYRVIGYPVVPILFCLSCVWVFCAAVGFAIFNSSYEALWSIGVVAAGFWIAYAWLPSRPATVPSAEETSLRQDIEPE
ncbi:MAG: amino acid permease [Pirellulales bacterium]|nr:amino acid permease [Pirellulales bacterium]